MYYQLTDHFLIRANPAEAWAFFSDAANLPAITPSWLGFKNRAMSLPTIQSGALLDYSLRAMGLPIRWRTLILDFEPPHRFVDLQLRGPYALWLHEHTFTPAPEGTECHDRVIYRLPLGPLGRLAHQLIVRRQLTEIFNYRRQVIGQRFGWVRPIQDEVKIQSLC